MDEFQNSILRSPVWYTYFLKNQCSFLAHFHHYISSFFFARNIYVDVFITVILMPCVTVRSAQCLSQQLQTFINICDNGLFSVVPMPKTGNCSFKCITFLLRNRICDGHALINNKYSISVLFILEDFSYYIL